MTDQKQVFHSNIWFEEPEADNPFAAKACYCHGYDVYGEVLGKASWAEYIYLMFKGERPSPAQAQMLEWLAVALANQGPRNAGVRAGMNGGVGGSVSAGSLMAALAVGAGQYGGAHEVFHVVNLWQSAGQNLAAWQLAIQQLLNNKDVDIWLPMEHSPGFDPNGKSCPTPVRQTLRALASCNPHGALHWLGENQSALEAIATCPLAMTGVAGAAFFDLGFSAEQAEMLFLILGMPGAAVQALEQKEMGWKKFPFIASMIELQDDPGSFGIPSIEEFGL